MSSSFNQVKQAHEDLMLHYGRMTDQVSELRFVLARDDWLIGTWLPDPSATGDAAAGISGWLVSNRHIFSYLIVMAYTFRYLVKLFVEAHIKKKLNHLSTSYTRLAGGMRTLDGLTPDHRTWLEATAQQCTNMAASLTSWRSLQGIVSLFGPWVLGLVFAYLEVDNFLQAILKLNREHLVTGLVILVIIGLPAAYLVIFLYNAFRYKRRLFLPSPGVLSIVQSNVGFWDFVERSLEHRSDYPNNVYKAEDELFDALDINKTREFPVDAAIIMLPISILVVLAVWWLSTGREVEWGDYWWLMALVGASVGAYILYGFLLTLKFLLRRWR